MQIGVVCAYWLKLAAVIEEGESPGINVHQYFAHAVTEVCDFCFCRCTEALSWFLTYRSPCAYFVTVSLVALWPKCTVSLVITRCWSLPTHISFLGVHARVYLFKYESLSSHIFLSRGRPCAHFQNSLREEMNVYVFMYVWCQRCILSVPLIFSWLELDRNSFACVCLHVCVKNVIKTEKYT